MPGALENRARFACLYAGAVWGLFWIPLRKLEGAGLHDLWITTIYFLVPALCALPVLGLRWRAVRQGGLSLQLTALTGGAALTFYSTSIIYTEVVRALMLYSLMPIWSTLLARMFLHERITLVHVFAMMLAALGILTLFGLGMGLPVPRNAGDWMGLASGIFWAITMVRVRMHGNHSAMDLTAGFFLWGLALSLGVALALAPEREPSFAQAGPVLPLLVAFVLFLLIPGTYASFWGPKFLNPGIVGLLLMTEIVVGTITAALFAGEPFGVRELVGVTLITGACLLGPLASVLRRNPAPA